MKRAAQGFVTAFSLYTILPVPPAKWDKDSMRYALCFFPVIGMVVMAAVLLWQYFALRFALSPVLFGAVATLLPLLVSGGIHLDGFLDTVDALASHAPPEKKLAILSDPHIGAFGVLGCGVWLLLSTGLWAQLYGAPQPLLTLPTAGYVLSRSLNGYGIARFPCAKTSGLAYLFGGSASRRAVSLTTLAFALAGVGFMVWCAPLWGGLAGLASLGYLVWHRRMIAREFGGNTGDLSGFLTQNIELAVLLCAALGGIFS